MSRVGWIFLIAVLAALPAAAIPVYINDPAGTTDGVYAGTQRFETRFRVSDTSWDLGIGPAGNNKTGNVGNNAALLPVTWQFEVLSDPTIGLRLRVKNSAAPSDPWNTVDWGASESLSGFTPFARAYNTLRLQVTATGTLATARSATLSRLLLEMDPNGVDDEYGFHQGLTNMTVTRTTPASNFSNFPSDLIGNDSHWVYTSGNFAAQAWRLTGLIDFNSNSGNPGNALKFSLFGSQYTFTNFPLAPVEPIPEPGTAGLVACAAALALLWRRMRGA